MQDRTIRGNRVHIDIRTGEDCPATNNAKPPLSGLCLRQDNRFNSQDPDTRFLTYVNNIVINIYLKDIWPAENRFEFVVIRDWMSWAARMKQQHGLDVHFKLRILPGTLAPQWMMNRCGSFPISAEGFETLPGYGEASSNCVKWFSNEYLTLWEQLMTALAEEFDDEKYLNEVVMSATAVGTGEAMEWAISNSGSGETRRDQYIAGGATPANAKAAILRGIDAMHAFQRTNIGIALTKYWWMENPTHGEINTTIEIGNYIAQAFRGRAVLGNNGLRTDDAPDGDKWEVPNGHMWQLCQHYRLMHARYGSRVYFQTASINNMGGVEHLIPTLNNGLNLMGSLVELPEGESQINEWLSTVQQALYKTAYKNNE